MIYEERVVRVKEVECELRAAQIELTKAINRRDFASMKFLQKECDMLKQTILGIAEPGWPKNNPKLDRPIDKRLYKL